MNADRIHYQFTDLSRKFSIEKGTKRSASMNHADTQNSQNFFKGRDPAWRHIVGFGAEVIVKWWARDYLQQEWLVDTKTLGRGDDGTDFPFGIQVKASNSNRMPDLLLTEKQWLRKKRKTKRIILVWVRSTGDFLDDAVIVGWISTEEIEKVHTMKNLLGGPTLVVALKDLHPMSELEEILKKEIANQSVAGQEYPSEYEQQNPSEQWRHPVPEPEV
jgi:hypothetical protein